MICTLAGESGNRLMHNRLIVAALGVLVGLALSQISLLELTHALKAQQANESTEAKDLDELRAIAPTFEKAYNAGDVKLIGAQFTENAEVIDEEGNIAEG